MPSMYARAVVVIAVAVVAASCDHYEAADVPGPRPAPAPTAALGEASPTDIPAVATSTEPCTPIVAPAPTAVVEIVRAPDGSCVPATEAVLYRCDPSFDPVVTLAIGATPRRFLGGRFATHVDRVPAFASPIGVTSAGRLWTVPGDDRSLYVESSDGVERWLALPRRKEVLATPAAAVVIGDSLMDGAREETIAALPGWTVTVDAEVGRGSYGAATVAESLLPPVPAVVVVEIGVNDHDPVGFAANIDRIAAAVDEPLLLLWLTAHGPDPDTDDINRAIVTGMGSLPSGAVADWDGLVPAEALDPDGVHLLADHQGVLADLVAGRLRAWRQAATGEGATGCEGTIRAAARRAVTG